MECNCDVQSTHSLLFTLLQELNHLLQSPLIANDHYASSEILQQIDRAVSLLSQSVGIRPAPEGSLRTGAGGLGAGGGSEIALEGGLVAAILQTAKGKKLMSRSINLLIPEQRYATYCVETSATPLLVHVSLASFSISSLGCIHI